MGEGRQFPVTPHIVKYAGLHWRGAGVSLARSNLGMSGHVYTVEFRIWSETLDPGAITNTLNLKPCQIRRDALPWNMPPEENIERDFLQAAVKRSQLLRAGEPKKANKEYDRIYRLKEKMRRFPDRGEAALRRISTIDDPDVQIIAAAALLALNEPVATALLERIRDSNRGLPSLTAEMTLKEWKNGSIREYWS